MNADAPAVQDFYPEDVAHCYGCGRLNEAGLRLRTRWDGDEWPPQQAVLTRSRRAHLVYNEDGYSAIWRLDRRRAASINVGGGR